MATVQFDAPQGADKTKVAVIVGGAIAPSAVRITVDSTFSKLDVLRALEAIEQKIIQGKWPAI